MYSIFNITRTDYENPKKVYLRKHRKWHCIILEVMYLKSLCSPSTLNLESSSLFTLKDSVNLLAKYHGCSVSSINNYYYSKKDLISKKDIESVINSDFLSEFFISDVFQTYKDQL